MSKIFNLIKILLISLFITTSINGCIKNVRPRGFNMSIGTLSNNNLKGLGKQEIIDLLGSPSSTSIYGEDTWYYISSIEEYYAFLNPIIKDQRIIELIFSNNKVRDINYYNLNHQKGINVNNDYTPSDGDDKSAVKSIFNNMGRFNKNERKSRVR